MDGIRSSGGLMVHQFSRQLVLSGALALLGFAGQASAQTVLADVHGLEPREIKVEAFTMSGPQDLRIAAVGEEGDRNSTTFTWVRAMWTGREEPREPWAGNAWILDLHSRHVVWELSASNTTRGRRGTREFSGNVHLPAGSYAAYVSAYPPGYNEKWDDGHLISRQFTGADGIADYKLVVQGSGQRLTSADVDRLRRDAASGAFVTFRGSTPEQFSQVGFSLTRPTAVDIYAIGEARENASFDYGWIINADTHEKIWKLDWRDSSPAGGAIKNRM